MKNELSNNERGKAPEQTEFINIADIVVSLNGRDQGKRLVVIATEDEYSLLADGKGRRIEKPKRKKNKHVKPVDKIEDKITAKLLSGEKVTNNEIRRALAKYAAECDVLPTEIAKGGM